MMVICDTALQMNTLSCIQMNYKNNTMLKANVTNIVQGDRNSHIPLVKHAQSLILSFGCSIFFPFLAFFCFFVFGLAYCCSVVVSIWWFSRKCTYVIVWISQNATLSDKNDDELNRAAESCVSVYVGSAVYELASRWWLTTDPGGTAILERLYPSNRDLTHTCLICKYFFKVLTDMISVVWIF